MRTTEEAAGARLRQLVVVSSLMACAAALPARAAEPPASRVPERVRVAPWKTPTDPGRTRAEAVALAELRLGKWITDVENNPDGRYRMKDVSAWTLDGRVLVADSYKVFEDGREDHYVKMLSFRRGTLEELSAHIYFDDGLFADAVLISDEEGVLRLDCDLVWPNGRTGQVRDIYVADGADRVLWFMSYVRNGVADERPAFATVLSRASSPD